MHKSVQYFLQIAQPGTYFETTLGRFIFVDRVMGGVGYEIYWQVVGGLWKLIPAFQVMGKLQSERSKKIDLNNFILEKGENCE